MDTLLRIALTSALGATALAVVAAMLSPLVRRPALTHVLWLLVLLKLVTPPLFGVPVHIGAADTLTAENAVPLVQRAAARSAVEAVPAPAEPRPRGHASLALSLYRSAWAAPAN